MQRSTHYKLLQRLIVIIAIIVHSCTVTVHTILNVSNL